MSYYFDGASSHLYSATTAVTSSNIPFTVISWVYHDGTAADRTIWQSLYNAGTATYYQLRLAATTADYVNCVARAGGSSYAGVSSSAVPSSSWKMVHGRWAANNSRIGGYSGGNEGTAESTSATPANLDTTIIGARGPAGASSLQWFKGYIAIVAVFGKDFSSSELAEATLVLPENHSAYSTCLVHYDFRTNDANINKNRKNPGTHDLTLAGTTQPAYSTENPTFGALNADIKLTVAPSSDPLSKIYMTWET